MKSPIVRKRENRDIMRSTLLLPMLMSPIMHCTMGIRIGSIRMLAKPRTKGVENYQTVSVACAKCDALLFRYKKKNGLKSNLIKCYVERMCVL